MWRALSKLTRFDWMVVGGGLMVVALLQVMPVGTSRAVLPVDTPDRPSRTQPDTAQPSQTPMSADARQALSGWQRNSSYFAAFALSDDGRSWGWAESFNTLAAAEGNALAHCGFHGDGCRIIDRRVPQGDRIDVPGSPALQATIADFLSQKGAGALAVSDNGASYWIAEQASVDEAEAKALALCEAKRKEGQADYLPDWPCRVLLRLER